MSLDKVGRISLTQGRHSVRANRVFDTTCVGQILTPLTSLLAMAISSSRCKPRLASSAPFSVVNLVALIAPLALLRGAHRTDCFVLSRYRKQPENSRHRGLSQCVGFVDEWWCSGTAPCCIPYSQFTLCCHCQLIRSSYL